MSAQAAAPRTGGVETFEGRLSPQRLRLAADEARLVRYVLCEWEADCGNSSSMGAQLLQLAQKAGKRERPKRMPSEQQWHFDWRCDASAQEIEVPHTAPSASRLRWPHLLAPENYCQKKREERAKIHRAWSSLKRLSDDRSDSLVILNALYGPMPPGVPVAGLWNKDTDPEYRRVARYARGSGGSGAALEAAVRVDKKLRQGETSDARERRIQAETLARHEILRAVGIECEKLIVQAALAYRAAWELSR